MSTVLPSCSRIWPFIFFTSVELFPLQCRTGRWGGGVGDYTYSMHVVFRVLELTGLRHTKTMYALLKASAQSFKRFTSRPNFKNISLSLSLSLSLYLLPRMNVILDFI